MQDGHAVPEALVELAGHGGGEGDLRHQQERAPAHSQRGLDGHQVDFGFSRAGDPKQQMRVEGVSLQRLSDGVERRLLVRIRRVGRPGGKAGDHPALRLERHEPLASERSGRRAAVLTD